MSKGAHGHDHGHSQDHEHAHAAGGAWLKLAIALTAGFAVVEAVTGVWAQSLALLSDAAHMTTDVAALLVSAIAIWISRKPASHRSSYGYLRAEVLGAIVNVAIIWTLAILLILESIERLQAPRDVQGVWVMGVGALGLLVNLFILARAGHGHAHHDHSVALKAARLHVLSDALGSVGATLSGVVIWWAGWNWLDPVVSLLISAAMVFMSWSILRQTLSVLMEFAPDHIDVPEVENALKQLAGVESIHDLHVWSLSVGRPSASAHLRVSQGDPQAVCRAATELLRTRFHIAHTTLQVECATGEAGSDDSCSQSCN